MSAIMTSRQAAELDHAFERNGWTAEDVKWLSKNKNLAQILCIRQGLAEITKKKHTLDLSASPKLPFDEAEVVKHEGKGVVSIELRSDDNLYIDGKKVVLHLSEHQMGDKTIEGHELRQELENGNQVLLNSNVLDYIYDHQELFPEHWKKNKNDETRFIFFWGSIFRRPSGDRLYVRYLFWDGGELSRFYGWLGYGWDRQLPSASVAS